MYADNEIENIFNTVCDKITKGASLRSVLLADDMPSSRTFYKWLDSDDEKVKQYARACEIRAEVMFEDVLDIADATADDIIIDGDGNEVVNHHVIQRDRLRVDARKWMLGKLQPKKYGDKLDVEIKKNPEFIVFDARKKESK